MSRAVQIEILTFAGCPNAEPSLELVQRIAAAVGVEADVRQIEVESAEQAERLHFLGSPTIRVDGRDVEPGADDRGDYALSCRVYRTDSGLAGRPDERWLRDALSSGRG
ncbi:MAG: DF family (seleno)protein [Gaiellaceae bacterium]